MAYWFDHGLFYGHLKDSFLEGRKWIDQDLDTSKFCWQKFALNLRY